MSKVNDEIHEILEHDPLGLLDIKPKSSGVMSADERLISSFQEINAFIEQHGHEPSESRDINERKLYSRLKSLRQNPNKASALQEHDTHDLLTNAAKQIEDSQNGIEALIGSDHLGLLDDAQEDDPNDIFKLTNIPKPATTVEYVAKRKACKEFKKFEPLFKQVHAGIKLKTKTTVPFKSERQIKEGEFFVVDGLIVYIAKVGKWEKKNFGNVNARLYCIFDNGTESHMLLRSLAAALWKDPNSRQIINADQIELYKNDKISEEDQATGYIYVLRTLSPDPKLNSIKDLYKIGYSSEPTVNRIKNAIKDPTYLMAEVAIIAEYQTYNLNPQKMELLLHKFFAKACLNMDIYDENGKRITPREWFVIPLNVIETAIHLLLSGDIVKYRYDETKQAIVERA